ncbi:MAG: hypothetical protein ABJN40_07360 [Sneathiella sp.]
MSIEVQTKTFSVEVECDPVSGKVLEERWHDNKGALNRPGDLPAYIRYCPDTGLPDYRRWHNGQGCHRESDLPASINTHTKTGIDTILSYEILGQYHRDGDKPAFIVHRTDGTIQQEDFWKYGKLHRDPQLGPARIFYSEDAKEVAEVEYWVNGTKISAPNIQPTLDM